MEFHAGNRMPDDYRDRKDAELGGTSRENGKKSEMKSAGSEFVWEWRAWETALFRIVLH